LVRLERADPHRLSLTWRIRGVPEIGRENCV
jgi:hypothetical protein